MLEHEEQAEDWFTREFLRRWKTYDDATTYEERLEALVLIRTPIAKPKPPKERPKKRSGSQWGKVKGRLPKKNTPTQATIRRRCLVIQREKGYLVED